MKGIGITTRNSWRSVIRKCMWLKKIDKVIYNGFVKQNYQRRKSVAETIDDCLKEMRLEEELMLKYIVTTYDENAGFIHKLKDNAPKEIQEYFPKWLRDVKKQYN